MLQRFIIVLFIATGVVLMALAMPEIIGLTVTAQTNEAEDTFACATGVATSCALTLSDPNYQANMAEITVTETSPSSVNRTADSSINASRTIVTVTGLSTATSYNFTVDYLVAEAEISTALGLFLDSVPILLGLLLAVLATVAIAAVLWPRPKSTQEAG